MKPIIFRNRQSSIYIGREARQGIKVKSGRIEKVKIGNGTAWKGRNNNRKGRNNNRKRRNNNRKGRNNNRKGRSRK